MGNDLSLFDSNSLQVPAHLQDLNEEGNIQDRIQVPSLSYEGKVWSIVVNGEKTQLVKLDADGDEVPLAIMRVVVLDYQQRRGRSYYEGSYDPSNAGKPVCFSDDGVKPHPSSEKMQASACDGCPMAVKGSRISESGKQVSACSQHRVLAVVPAHKMDMEPLRMKIAVTSDYDKENDLEAKGWLAFQQYRDFLKARGINHTAMLVTKMRFDPGVAYPKVLFSPDRWVEADEKAIVNPKVKSDEVAKILSGEAMNPSSPRNAGLGDEADDTGNAVNANDDDDEAEAAAAAAAKKKADAKKKAEAEAKKKAEAEAKKKAEADAKKKANPAIVDDDDDDDDIVVSTKKATTASGDDDGDNDAIDGEIVSEVSADVAELLADWDED
jgi:hypothetical protein